jgi:hypothetical protein
VADEAEGAGERDEPPGAGASLRRIDEKPPSERQAAGEEGEAFSYEGEVSALHLLYGARIEATQRSAPKHERAAAIRALRQELRAALREVTERRRNESAARREARLRSVPAPDFSNNCGLLRKQNIRLYLY